MHIRGSLVRGLSIRAVVLGLLAGTAVATLAQQTGSVEFAAHVAPTEGQPEPARGITFYLLRKSFAEITRESEAAEPALQMEPFIEKLDVSAPMKAWMKSHQHVELSGPDLPKLISAQDVFDVPEFSDAYTKRNEGDPSVKLPPAKYKSIDKKKQPEKYQAALDQYHEAMRQFITIHPETLETMYLELQPIDPAPRWRKMEHDRQEHIRRHALELAGLRYSVAKTDTDLDGRGRFANLAPGQYWLSTLATPAAAGDVRLRWDVAIHVAPGSVAAAELSNLNAVDPRAP